MFIDHIENSSIPFEYMWGSFFICKGFVYQWKSTINHIKNA